MRKAMMIGGVLLVALALLGAALSANGSVVGAQAAETAVVQRTTLSIRVESTGTILPERTVYLSFGTAGTVQAVAVEVGDTVTAGQTLASLDTADLETNIALYEQDLAVQQAQYDELTADPAEQEIAQAEASLAAAQAQLQSAENALANVGNQATLNCAGVANAEDNLARAEENFTSYVNNGYEWDANFIPDPDSEPGRALRDARTAFDVEQARCGSTPPVSSYASEVEAARTRVVQAQTALDALLAGPTAEAVAVAEARLEQTRLRLDNARAALADAQIVAPFDGEIAAVNIVEGASVNVSSIALTLVDVHPLHVAAALDENDIPQVAIGQPVLITPDALEGTTLAGTVTRIAPLGSSTDGIVTYTVQIDFAAESSAPVLAGMTTSVEIVVGAAQEVLVVPTEAVQRDGTTEYVAVQNEDGGTTRVNVTSGITVDGQTVIEGDIAEGMRVVIPPARATSSGFTSPFGGG